MVYQRILVGLDGSDNSDRAFKTGVALAQALDATLYLTWIVNRDRGMDVTFNVNEDFYQDLYDQTVTKLDTYLQKAKDQGLTKVEAAPRMGNVKTVLAQALPLEYDLDLIVLGDTGINQVKAMLIGSHSSYVIRHSKCDVLIVK